MALHPTLRITKWIHSEEDEIKRTDFTTFLRKESPVFDKGRKTESHYTDPDTGELVVKKVFADLYDPDVTDRNKLIGVQITLEWYDNTDTVLITKTFDKPLNFVEAATIVHNRRIASIDYLKAAGKGTPVEDYQMAIFEHYEAEIRTWYDMGGEVLSDAILSETDPLISTYLDIETEPGWTVRDGILYQITHTWGI